MFKSSNTPSITRRSVNSTPPKQVDWAVGLFWITLFLEIPAHVVSSEQAYDTPFWDLSFVLLIGAMALLNILILRGINWARITRSALAILGFLAVFSNLSNPAFVLVLVNILGLILDAQALYWLFGKQGSLWFKR